jgi:archaellum component FlaC
MEQNKYEASKIDINILGEKIGAVHRVYEKMLAVLPSGVPKSVGDPAKFMKDRMSRFGIVTKHSDPNIDEAADLGEQIANAAINIVHAFAKYPEYENKTAAERKKLLELSRDLKDYSESHLIEETGKDPVGLGVPLVQIKHTRETLPDVQASIEVAERKLSTMEAQLNGLSETAENVSLRVERVVAALGDDARKAVEAEKESLAKKITEVADEASSVLTDLTELHRQAKILAGDISTSALAKDYARHAVEESRAANFYRRIGLLFMLIVGAYLGFTLWDLRAGGFTWEQAGLRLAVSLVATLPIAYVARESARHRVQAVELRKTSLDFAALGPYLEGIPEPKRSELRALIAQRVFFADAKSDNSSSFGLDPQAIIMKGMETIADLAKQKRP